MNNITAAPVGALVAGRRTLAMGAAAAMLAACSSLPDVQYSYYPAKSLTAVTVTQTVDCTSDGRAVVVVSTPSISTAYSADYTKGPYSVRIKAIEGSGGTFADSDIAFTFFDDGRLKSINQSTTGQGETIIKSAVQVVSSLALLGGGAPAAKGAPALPECKVIQSAGAGKPVTLTYAQTWDVSAMLGKPPQELPPTPSSKQLYDGLKNQLPVLAVAFGQPAATQSGARYVVPAGGASSDLVALTLQNIASIRVDVRGSGATLGGSVVAVPVAGTYDLPIPTAALFGKQNFALTLNEAGAVVSVDYGKTAGAAGALNAINAAATAAAPESTANQAADVKAQADLIAQQQRLIRCQTHPAQCQ